MNKMAVGIGLLIVAGVVGSILFATRKNRLEVEGDVLKVRSHQIDSDSTVAVIDLRLRNPSAQPFQVKEVEVFVDDVNAGVFSDIEAQRLFDYYPVLGTKYNQSLLRRDKIEPGQQIDRMIAIRFPGTDGRFQSRKQMRFVILETDRAKREFLEKR